MGEVGYFKNGINKNKEDFGFGIPFINLMDVFGKTSIAKSNYALVNANKKECELYNILKGDVLFIRSSVKREGVGETSLVIENIPNTVYSGFLIRYRMNDILFCNLFKKYCFATPFFRKKIISMSTTSANTNINQESLSIIKISFPTISEQTKIANFLSKLDERIEIQRTTINKLETLIKGCRQKLYTKKEKQIRIKDILSEINKKTTLNNQYEVLSSTVKGIFKQSKYFDRKVASENNIGYKILEKGQIVLSPQNLWMGNINYNDEFNIGIVSPSYKIFNINENYNRTYIAFLLKSHRAFFEYKNASEQGASVVRRNLNMDLFNEISFTIPKRKEQDKIAKILISLSQKLKTEQELLSAYEQQKKYFLQNMFV